MVPPLRPDAGEVIEGRLRARQHHDVGIPRQRAGEGRHHEIDRWLHPERVEVVDVRDARQQRDDDLDAAARRGDPRAVAVEAHGVLGRQAARRFEPRHNAPAGPAGSPLDLPHAVVEPRSVTPKPVDREAGDERRVAGVEQCPRADERGDHPAAVDVSEETDRRFDAAREAHVGDVTPPQVGLGGAAGAFDDDQVAPGGEPLEAVEDAPEELTPAVEERPRGPRSGHPPLYDDLRGSVGLGLEQHRVHVDRGGETRGPRLERLRAPDLAAARADGRVVRHVLRLERRDPKAAPARQTAEPRHHGRLAGVGAGALHHQAPPPHAAPATETNQSPSIRRTVARTP